MVDALEHYNVNMKQQQEVLEAMRNEAVKQFEDRLVDSQAKKQFQKLITPIFGPASETIFTIEEGKLTAISRQKYKELLATAIKSYEN